MIDVAIGGTQEAPSFLIRCQGTGARPPLHLPDFISGSHTPTIDAMSIQAYYTWRLSGSAGMHITISKDGDDILRDITER